MTAAAVRDAHLVIVTNVPHYRGAEGLLAYGPYAREAQVWADAFARVTVAAPLRDEAPPGDCAPIVGAHVRVSPQVEAGGNAGWAKLRLVASLPRMAWRLLRAARGADLVHVRCPCNLGLLALVLAPLLGRRVAKYAGQWAPYPGEPVSYRLQRRLLASRWWGAPVLAYTAVSEGVPNVVPAFASVMTPEQMARARSVAMARPQVTGRPLRALFVGRISQEKGVGILLDAVERLDAAGRAVELTVIGDGPLRASLEERARGTAALRSVRFAGAMSFAAVLDRYGEADCLVLPSRSEGWPKAAVEAMAHGLVVIGPARGLVPFMLAERRGYAVPPGDAALIAETLARIIDAPAEALATGRRAAAWAMEYTLAGVQRLIDDAVDRALCPLSPTPDGR